MTSAEAARTALLAACVADIEVEPPADDLAGDVIAGNAG